MTSNGDYTPLKNLAAYYAGTPGLEWKIMPVHGVRPDGRCTCGEPHTDPKDVGKHPAISNWQNAATSDVAQISAWWDVNPMYNIAVMAALSNFVVIDIDPRSGGEETIEKFEAIYPNALTPTVEAYTGVYQGRDGKPARGRHLFYKFEGNESLIGKMESISKEWKGVDVKRNGYVLLAPSNHFSGVSYEWREGHAPWELAMAEANEELLGALRKSGGRNSPRGGSSGNKWEWVGDLEWSGEKLDVNRFFDEGIDEGSRAVDIYAMACALANKFGTDTPGREAVMSTMQKFNAERVRPPMEWEGTNSLTMHVERAIEFVANKPKTEMFGSNGPGAVEYIKRKQEELNNPPVLQPVPTFSRPKSEWAPQTSDPDDLDYSPYPDADLPGSIGGQVRDIAYNGGSIMHRALDVPKDPDALTTEEGGNPDKRSLSDLGNGRRFVDSFGHVIRYTPGLGWFNWTDGYWRPDAENLGTREHAKRLSAIIAREVVHYSDNDEQGKVIKWADATKANSRQNNALESATSDPRIFVDVEGWDSEPTLFGTTNGVVDLKTGDLLKGRPDLYITRRAPVKYTPGLINERWMQFLDFGTGGDKEYQDWLQKAAGYTLTGLRTHDVMFLVYGPGGSGKNVLIEALVKAMGTKEYAWPMDSQILAQGDGQANSTDLYHWAELRGRRMVWVDELPESERLKENSVKKLTGSSEISARSPGEKPFTFASRAKLWVTTNHRPIITDDAMWRRIRPIPWLNVPENPDPGLKEYIFDPEGGLPGVLAWAVEGARKILNSTDSDSLGWCKVVSDAAEVYRKAEDRMGRFLEEETVEAPGETLAISVLFSVYEGWSSRRNERPMSAIAFDRKLQDRRIEIVGDGKTSALNNRKLAPIEALPPGQNWDLLSRNYGG